MEGNLSVLCKLCRGFMGKHPIAVILSFNHALRHPLDIRNRDLVDLSHQLSNIEHYCRNLVELLRTRNLCNSDHARKLTGIRSTTSNEFRAVANSYAKRLVEQSSSSRPTKIISKASDGSIQVGANDLHRLLRDDLQRAVRDLLNKVHSELLEVRVLRPCLEYLLCGDCKLTPCQNFHPKQLSKHLFRLYFRVHMQIVTTLDYLWHVPILRHYNNVREDVQREWTERVFSVLFPVTRMFGDYTLWSVVSPEAPHATRLVRSWVEQRIRNLDPYQRNPLYSHFTTDAIMLLLMARVIHGTHLPSYLWHDLKMYRSHADLMEWDSGSLVIHDATWLLVCDSQEPARQGVKFLS